MNDEKTNNEENKKPDHFIQVIIKGDLASNKNDGKVHTRFPPEPNGYLHIGHAKSICLNFGMAQEFGGLCNLRFDDTNPTKEDVEYVDSIEEDVKWLGFNWDDRKYYASDYFQKLYDYAVQLIQQGDAFVCDLNADQIREHRGTLTEPGKNSPFRGRSIDENLDLFARMKKGEFADGSKVLRAKINMASPNINLRDPVIYRILKAHHHRTGDQWCIYPMYDFAHGICDSLEGITHSICTLEFEDHRPLYDWFLEKLQVFRPQQIEFARLNMTYTLMSKRKLLQLVQETHVDGWDDPRMPTIAGMRRRGYTPEAIREFCDRIGVAKRENTVDISLLEYCLREDLNKTTNRVMAVLDPLKVIITNYPEGQTEELPAINNPEDEKAGSRMVPFGREIFIEREDFLENPPKKFFRLSPGQEVRLRYAYFITCQEVVKDSNDNIQEIRCTYDPLSKGGNSPDGRKVKGTIHWVSAAHALKAKALLYDRLFTSEDPQENKEGDFTQTLNPESLITCDSCLVEPCLADAKAGDRYQFERKGYFCADKTTTPENLIFNRIVTLRDSWAKAETKA